MFALVTVLELEAIFSDGGSAGAGLLLQFMCLR